MKARKSVRRFIVPAQPQDRKVIRIGNMSHCKYDDQLSEVSAAACHAASVFPTPSEPRQKPAI